MDTLASRRGDPIVPSAPLPLEPLATAGHLGTSLTHMWVRDPELFLAGELHKHVAGWDNLTQSHPQKDQIISWIKKQNQHSRVHYPFCSTYQHTQFNHGFPPDKIFSTDKSYISHAQVISDKIEKKIAMGAITVLWQVHVGEVPPSHIVMPFCIESSKPCVVQDQQYLNCFMRHCPFTLDQVINLPRIAHETGRQVWFRSFPLI